MIPTVYFVWISKNWYWVYLLITLICSVPQAILVYFLPDSPMLYYEEEEFQKAKTIYKDIALADGIKLGSFNFDEEVKKVISKVEHH